ncbi:MAG TPA: DUF4388 domain-containing protein [Pyrinomonadaceae bacterium]|nr:DUF4388 domain-containing protein [Pyrinomonadaceae bacterium]
MNQEVENVERTQFVVLTGHLDDHPLPELIRRLRVERKTGRLQVEYADGPGAFFFEDGLLVDARLGNLRGVEAVYAALALGGASFNFNPLVRPPERNIDRQGQQFIRDLVEAPRREGLAEVRVAARDLEAAASDPTPRDASRQLPPAAELVAPLVAPLEVRLVAVEEAINSASRRFSRERLVYAMVIGFLTGLSVIAVLNVVFDPFRPAPAPAAVASLQPAPPPADKAEGGRGAATGRERDPAASESDSNRDAATPEQVPPPVPSSAAVIGTRRSDGLPTPRGAHVVQVLVEVRDGRVTEARVWNPRPGAGAYESVALKMARERHYPKSFTGSERLRISVKP